DVPADQPGGGQLRVRGGGRGEDEGGVGAVMGGDPAQAPHHHRDVAAEHAPVAVALVDHHVAQGAEEVRPLLVPGQEPEVQHVGVGEHHGAVAAHPAALLGGGVAVVHGDAGVADPGAV